MNFYRPKVFEQTAKETHFIRRKRKLNATTFMRLLFDEPGGVAGLSLTSLCSRLAEQRVIISKQALNNRFNEQAVRFMERIYLHLFEAQSKQFLHKLPMMCTMDFRSMRVLDGTTVQLPEAFQEVYPGTVGAGIKYQVEFDYLTGRFLYMEKQAGKASDVPSGMKRLGTVQKDDVLLQDLGYFKFDLLKEIEEKGAFYVSRARIDSMFYIEALHPRYHPNGEIMKKYAHDRLFLEEELQTMQRGECREYPSVYLGKHERLAVRLITYYRTEEEQKRQEQRMKRREQTKPGEIKQKARDLSGLSIYITNLPMEVPRREIISLYRYRWQIELVFKTWKSEMKVNHYRNMKLERWECHLYAELILLLLSLLITYQLRIYFWKEQKRILSEQIAMRVISQKLKKLWQVRASPWRHFLEDIISLLASIGRKNVKEPGPMGWLE